MHGRSQQAIEETIRICTEQGVLAEFLGSRKKAVQDIMVTLFDQEKVMEFHDYNLAKEQRAEEKEVNIRAMIKTLQMLSTSREDAVHLLVANWELSPKEAEDRVSRYWED